MFSLFRKKEPERIPYDREKQKPAVRRSICTGEMTGGFFDLDSGQFSDLMRLDGQEGLREFCKSVDVKEEDITTIY